MGPPYIGPPRKPPLFRFEWSGPEGLIATTFIAIGLIAGLIFLAFLPGILGWG